MSNKKGREKEEINKAMGKLDKGSKQIIRKDGGRKRGVLFLCHSV
jgi:hypothetical protein